MNGKKLSGGKVAIIIIVLMLWVYVFNGNEIVASVILFFVFAYKIRHE